MAQLPRFWRHPEPEEKHLATDPCGPPSHVPWSDSSPEPASQRTGPGPQLPDPESEDDALSGSPIAPSGAGSKPHGSSLLLATHLCLLAGSVCGVLARKGLLALTAYSGSPLSGVVWANFAACVAMGTAAGSGPLWRCLVGSHPHFASTSAIPLYAALTTGFCGSCSSFSTLVLEAVGAAANLPPTSAYPNAAYGILGALEVLASNIALSVGGLRVGAHLARALAPSPLAVSPNAYKAAELATCIFGVSAYAVVVVLIATESHGEWRTWTFACLFAPWGTFLRFWLARALNPVSPKFPVGTFTANFGGTLLLAVFYLLAAGKTAVATASPIVSASLPCHVLLSLGDGFCGCLTTVSTFAVELSTLRLASSYIYACASVASSFTAMLLILGCYNWTVGLTVPVC